METFYAPAERYSSDQLNTQQSFLLKNRTIISLLNSIPTPIMILNNLRQIVFLNQSANELLHLDIQKEIGNRPGESIKCYNAEFAPNGCGTGEYCKYCGAVNSILSSQLSNYMETNECRIQVHNGDKLSSLDLLVSAKKMVINKIPFTIFSLEDISDRKRRKVIEKSFFHDIINLINSIQGVLTILDDNISKEKSEEFLSIALAATNELVEEIKSHRLILNAEANDLNIDYSTVNTKEIIDSVIDTASFFDFYSASNFKILPSFINTDIQTDKQIIKRVLLNMVKNAIEASSNNGLITINAYENEQGQIEFSVHNIGYMTDEVKSQIFHRSFSTKGSDRGLGTYSMKLLIENYLKGSVYFTSTQGEGTTFYCAVPKEKPR